MPPSPSQPNVPASPSAFREVYPDLIDQAPYGIYWSSVDGHFTYVNPALVRMLGYDSADELLALDMARDIYVDPAERSQLIQRSRSVHDATGPWRSTETRWKRRDGAEILVQLSGAPLRDAAGRVTGFHMMVEDVTDRRQLEERLRQSQKMEAVGQLTAGIAHDFNNLLTVILGNLDLVAEALPADLTDLTKDLGEIREAARRGAEMVRKLSAFGRSEPLRLRPAELGGIVRDTVRLLRRTLPTSIELVADVPQTDLVLLGDPAAIEQILLNLATNARDAMAGGGTVRIIAERRQLTDDDRVLHPWVEPGEYVCLTVADNGSGMDQRTLGRIFEPFFTTKARGEGTGLGMAMVYGLVKQHGGYIHLYSEVGQGTCVRLYFPLLRDQAHPAGGEAEPAVQSGGTETLLVVEDDPKVASAARRVLEKRGYRVLSALDGVRALELLRERGGEIDLVLADIVMPRMGGRQLYDVLRAGGTAVPVVLTSGYTAGMIDDGYATVPFLHKPWTVVELLNKVREVLDGTGGRAERRADETV